MIEADLCRASPIPRPSSRQPHRDGRSRPRRAGRNVGFCGSMKSRRSGWKLTLPPPHGHSPASARTSVLLPVPDSPATSSRSPGPITTSVSPTTAVPSSSVTERSLRTQHGVALGLARLMRPMPSPCSARSRPSRRHHQRSDAACAGVPVCEPRIIVDQPAERCLHDGVKAEAACITCPAHAAVEKFGCAKQQRNHGCDQADPCDTSVVRMCWPASRAHCRRTFVKVLSMPSRSSSSPPSSVMLSPFSAHARQRIAILGLGLVLVFGHLRSFADRHDHSEAIAA